VTARPRPRERIHLPTLILNPYILGERDGEVIGVVMAATKSPALLRVLLERRSDVNFIADLHASLRADGIAERVATDALYRVINSPSVAIRMGQRDPRRTAVLQAVAVDDSDDSGVGRMVLVVRATVVASKPPEVEDATVELLPVDWDVPDDQGELARHFASWWQVYRQRPDDHNQPYEDAPRSCAWLGHPDGRNYREVPNGWESDIKALGAILGMAIHIGRSPQQAAAQSLAQKSHFAILINGTPGWDRLRDEFEEQGKDLLECGSPGTEFTSLLAAARQTLISHVLDCINPGLPALRELAPGETIYHRKISPQPRTFDRFDAGSPVPCQHGAEGFVRWSGDKAVKGMLRRYSNFEAKMLHHCPKFPACGVYAVKA
jgi:hypothetical protein